VTRYVVIVTHRDGGRQAFGPWSPTLAAAYADDAKRQLPECSVECVELGDIAALDRLVRP
jgi:hypothetical protein